MLSLICFSLSAVNSTNSIQLNQVETTPNEKLSHQPVDNGYIDSLTGLGDARLHQLYIENVSSTSSTNDLNITSNANEFLNDGSFNFTFAKNYNTTYEFEDDSPLYYPLYRYTPEPTYLSGTLENGVSGDDMTDYKSDDSEFYQITTQDHGPGGKSAILNVTSDMIGANGANDFEEGRTISDFDKIASLHITTIVSVTQFVSDYVLLAYDYIEEDWDVVDENVVTITGSSYTSLVSTLVNDNGRYFNSSSNPQFSLVFSNSSAASDYYINLQYFKVSAYESRQVEVLKNQPVALEFDVKGDSTIYGFQAWIRTLNSTKGSTSELKVELYNSNQTAPIKRSELLDTGNDELIAPNFSQAALASNSYLNYSGDGLTWFNFTSDGTGIDLDVGNYFVVISSNLTDSDLKEYALVTIPYADPYVSFNYEDPDRKIDHLLISNTTKWEQVTAYASNYACDAAGFAINITRAYFPSEIDMKLDEVAVQNSYITNYPHDEIGENTYGEYWWGYGTVDITFTEDIVSNNGNFTIPLEWDTDVYTGDMDYQVNYDIIKYLKTPAVANYILNLDEDPVWNVTFDLDLAISLFDEGDLTQMAFNIPKDWTLLNVYHSNGTDILDEVTQVNYDEDSNIVVINSDLVNDVEGDYILQATSPNYIQESEIYLNYNDNLWTSNGFMTGDDIHTKIGLLDGDEYLSDDGAITIRVFNPSDNIVATISDTTIDRNETYSWFDFDTDILSNVAVEGSYNIVANWSDGEELGLYSQEFYVNHYESDILEVEYDAETGNNRLISSIDTFPTDIQDYNVFLYGVKNWTNQAQTTPAISSSEETILDIDKNIYMTNYVQDENFLNPDEDITINITLENRNLVQGYDLDVSAKLVMYQNNEWIIVQATDSATLEIYDTGAADDEHVFSFTLNIPTVLEGGVNCPIRNAPMVVEISVSANSEEIYNAERRELLYYSSLDESDFEGEILLVKEYADASGPGFIGSLERDVMNFPDYSYYFMQISNEYLQTMDHEVNNSQYYKAVSEIENLAVEQDSFTQVSTVNLVGNLLDEYSNSISSAPVELYYNTTDALSGSEIWNKATLTDASTQVSTDSEGYFDLEFDLENVPIAKEIQFEVRYAGDANHLAVIGELDLVMNTYDTEIYIQYPNDVTLIEGKSIVLDGIVRNDGNSTLNNITIEYAGDVDGKIQLLNTIQTDLLEPGQSLSFQIVVLDNSIDQETVNITISVSATIIETNDVEAVSSTQEFSTYSVNEENLANMALLIVFGVGLIGLYFVSVRFIKSKYQDINAPLKDATDLLPQQRTSGKYVTVDDIEEAEPASDEDVTTLDDLLDKEE